jgi:hypothetical protein
MWADLRQHPEQCLRGPYVAGLCRRAAWKRDCWHDVAYMQLDLPETGGLDRPLGPIRLIGGRRHPGRQETVKALCQPGLVLPR